MRLPARSTACFTHATPCYVAPNHAPEALQYFGARGPPTRDRIEQTLVRYGTSH